MEVRTWKLFGAFLCCIGFLLAFSRAQKEDSAVHVTEKVVKFGDFFVLNCSSNSSSSSSCDIQEESSFSYNYTEVGPTWKVFTFIVNNWSLHVSCVVNCTNNEISYPETIVTVYQPPESVELDPVPEMEVGKPYDLTCQVSDVAPIRNFTVTLLKGAEQLLVKTFENHTAPEAGPVVVKHTIIAQRNDHKKPITCQTSLDLRPRGPLLKKNYYSILTIFGTTGNISEETVFPQNGAVTQRNLPWLNNHLTSNSLIDWSLSTSPRVERTMKETYQPLVQLTLELQKPSPDQSWTYHLICHILRVHPCYNLTVAFFKGSKRFNSPSFINCTRHEVTNITIPLPVILHPEDHGQKAYCHADVYFSLHEPAYQTTSSGLSLKTDELKLSFCGSSYVQIVGRSTF
ncbi:intercellular adhesion molecule 2-like isoform 2-T2 [Liasis olivaceus]